MPKVFSQALPSSHIRGATPGRQEDRPVKPHKTPALVFGGLSRWQAPGASSPRWAPKLRPTFWTAALGAWFLALQLWPDAQAPVTSLTHPVQSEGWGASPF